MKWPIKDEVTGMMFFIIAGILLGLGLLVYMVKTS